MNETLKVLFSAKAKKAFVAFGATSAGTLGGLCSDGNLSGSEVVISFGAGLVALAAVFGVKNKT